MNKKRIDLVRVLAVLVVVLGIAYFHLNILFPTTIPKSLRIGILRKPVTILLVGTDITYDRVTHKPMPEHRGRADTILLTRIDPIRWKINVLSIPRDTYLSIPGREAQKINVVNAWGGIPLLKRTVSDFTGQKIDYYIKAKPTAITKLVDMLGGVYLKVEENMRYVDRVQGLNIDLKMGWQKLSGKQAHDYIRYRDNFSGDIGRIARQQKFFKALSKSLTRPANILNAPRAIRTALQEIETDMPLGTTVRLLNMARMMEPGDLRTEMTPGEVSFVRGVGSIWMPDQEALQRVIREMF